MTTGRINQVTAEERHEEERFASNPRVAVAVICLDRCFLACVWSRMRPRMGFALVRTSHHAGVSTRLQRMLARICRGTADRGLSYTSTLAELF